MALAEIRSAALQRAVDRRIEWKQIAAWQTRGSTCIHYTPRDSILVVGVRAISGSSIGVEDAWS
ncbi:hypothetical protein AS156_05095 [Bradyrhizobium macuxiense]|uniref:Uncharacterized protein n=1 Tax=Bradyrhizobium macuxiense TaxID=1755647 RepID=A0A109JVS0_9BRAD|nr:hypothetical protein AS156_05095 [Bradyrhizobium macuxiense]